MAMEDNEEGMVIIMDEEEDFEKIVDAVACTLCDALYIVFYHCCFVYKAFDLLATVAKEG